MRRVTVWALATGLSLSATAQAETAIDRQLKQLDPSTRMIQVCDLSGLKAFARDKTIKAADRVRIDALSAPQIKGDTVTGSGGALRAGGRWIGFSYTCSVTADRMKATAFTYAIGKAIPPDEWDKFNLWR